MKSRLPLTGLSVVTAIITAIIAGFWPTFSNLIGASENADFSAHVIFVLFAFFMLIWNARSVLASLPIQPFLPALIGLLGAGFIWLSGEIVFARVLTHVGVLAMIPTAIVTILGYRWLAALGFPLAFLLFAIPIGGSLVPVLVEWTASFTSIGLQITGVPVHREGAYLIVPSGAWAVADACSGIAYLRTVSMLSVLYAWSMYRSLPKQLAFIAGAVVIGITGNWLRAYLTILIAHLSDNRYLRDDHSTFGWAVFALLLFAYSAIGYRYRDAEIGNEQIASSETNAYSGAAESPTPQLATFPRTSSASVVVASVAAIATIAAIAVWPVTQRLWQDRTPDRTAEIADIAPALGWVGVATPAASWKPNLTNPSRERVQSFEKAGRRVDVFIGIFDNQTWGSKLVTVVNGFATQEKTGSSLAVRGEANTVFAGQPLNVDTGLVVGGGTRILAWRWYWIRGLATASDSRAKWAQLTQRLSGQSDAGAWLSIHTDATASHDDATVLLAEFMRDMTTALQESLVLRLESIGTK